MRKFLRSIVLNDLEGVFGMEWIKLKTILFGLIFIL